MGFRELTMIDVRELLRRRQAGESARRAARECGADRKMVKRYYEAAEQCGADGELTDELVAQVARVVQGRPVPPPSDAWKALVPVRARIEGWLTGERPLRLVRIHELLAREGVKVSYSTEANVGTSALSRGWSAHSRRRPSGALRGDRPRYAERARHAPVRRSEARRVGFRSAAGCGAHRIGRGRSGRLARATVLERQTG
jgi:hypothetical protein